MKPLLLVFIIVVMTVSTGCVGQNIKLSTRFDSEEAAFIKDKGDNTITGVARFETWSGNVRTCSDGMVSLIPVTEYSLERIEAEYKDVNSGYKKFGYNSKPTTFSPEDSRYQKYQIIRKCNQYGEFTFPNIPDGEYFIVATIRWEIFSLGWGRMMPESATLMKRVAVSGGSTAQVDISF